jgi:hypothetical protein
VHDIEKSIKVLRGAAGSLRLAQIVEKGFFIDSEKSRVLQLCDLCALSVRKKEEAKEGKKSGQGHKSGSRLTPARFWSLIKVYQNQGHY